MSSTNIPFISALICGLAADLTSMFHSPLGAPAPQGPSLLPLLILPPPVLVSSNLSSSLGPCLPLCVSVPSPESLFPSLFWVHVPPLSLLLPRTVLGLHLLIRDRNWA